MNKPDLPQYEAEVNRLAELPSVDDAVSLSETVPSDQM
jgi:hypothetical protein